jgi:hypothetical protein
VTNKTEGLAIVVQVEQLRGGDGPLSEEALEEAQRAVIDAARDLAEKKLKNVREVQARVGMVVVADFAADNEGVAKRLKSLGCERLADMMSDPALSSEVRTLWNRLQSK